MSETPPLPTAGWYTDPADAASERWWDGTAWGTDTRQVAAAPEVAPVEPSAPEVPEAPEAPATPTAPPVPPVPPIAPTPPTASAPPAPAYSNAGPGYTPNAGPGYTPPASSAPMFGAAPPVKRGNGLGIASVVLGGLAFIGAFIPFVDYGSGLLALVGLALGIIGLVQKGRSKGLPITGAILSVVALVLSIVLAIVYTIGFLADLNDSFPSAPFSTSTGGTSTSEPDSGESSSTGDDSVGTKESPAPIGSTVTLTEFGTKKWEVTPGAPNLDANDAVKKANQFNEEAPAGSQWAILPLTVKYLGDDREAPFGDIQVEFVAADGNSYEPFDHVASIPNDFDDINEMSTGATATGDVAIAVPTADIDKGHWVISDIVGDDYYYAAQ